MQGPPGSLYGEDAAVFAGFTSTPVTGAVGSREQMHAMCGASFTGSHLCHAAEYELANSATPVPSDGAWLDSSGAADGSFANAVIVDYVASRDSARYTGAAYDNCSNWTSTTSTSGLLLRPSGAFTGASCATTHVLTCCATPYRERFRGFTTTTTTGAAGGRTRMHLLCGREFPGSHLCHVAEYNRAEPSITPPVAGAWVDLSGYATPSGGVSEVNLASSHLGRVNWTGVFVGSSPNCDNWTSINDGAPLYGTATYPQGASDSSSCSIARPLACCE